jgi:DNA repair protein RadC
MRAPVNSLSMWSLERSVILMNTENPFKLDVVSVRLVKDAPLMSGHPITSPEEAVELLGEHLCQMDREVICVINFRADGTPINCHFASIGSLNESLTHPREIFKASILSNAAFMMLMHNHPSGKLLPSKEDTMLTDRMLQTCKLMGIPLVDHVIVGGDNTQYFSFLEKKLLKAPKIEYLTDYREIDMASGFVAEQGKAR